MKQATKNQKEDFLGGYCVSFANAYLQTNPDAEIATVFDNGSAFHIVARNGHQIIDVTGIWENESDYLENLKNEMTEIFPDDEWNEFEIINMDKSSSMFSVDDEYIQIAKNLLN